MGPTHSGRFAEGQDCVRGFGERRREQDIGQIMFSVVQWWLRVNITLQQTVPTMSRVQFLSISPQYICYQSKASDLEREDKCKGEEATWQSKISNNFTAHQYKATAERNDCNIVCLALKTFKTRDRLNISKAVTQTTQFNLQLRGLTLNHFFLK